MKSPMGNIDLKYKTSSWQKVHRLIQNKNGRKVFRRETASVRAFSALLRILAISNATSQLPRHRNTLVPASSTSEN